MRIALLVLVTLLGMVAAVATFGTGCSRSASEKGAAVQYHCPMHPTVVSDKSGDCPICGMKLVPMAPVPAPQHNAKKQAAVVKYHCPMHPTVVSDKPGDCPICEMKLEPVAATAGDAKTPSGLAAVSIAPSARERMGLTLGTVVKRPLARELRTSARIVPDETRLYSVTVKIDGYVEKLFAATTGEFVKQGAPLLTVYSPMLLSAQLEYLSVLKDSPDLAAAARQRLKLWDLADEQIDRLARSGQPDRVVTLSAPASGWIIERKISAGSRVMAGEQLLVLGDLTNVWGDADIYQSDLPYVKTGIPVRLTVSAAPDKAVAGRVTFIAPVLDAETRTIKVRMEVPNSDLLLRPEMYAVAHFTFDLGEKLAIPDTAIMRTGEHTYAFRDAGEGRLIPTEIEIGARSEGWFELRSGLADGDRVVTSANFLVDSESSMKAALESIGGP